MSTDRKTYRRVIPVAPGADLDLLRWLTRESFDTTAAGEALQIVEYSDAETIPPTEITAGVAAQLDRPISEYEWREFTAIAERPTPEPPEPVCGYCQHPPHADGECDGHAPTWMLTEQPNEPPPCTCVGVAALSQKAPPRSNPRGRRR